MIKRNNDQLIWISRGRILSVINTLGVWSMVQNNEDSNINVKYQLMER
jgi:hypothetical protein